MAALRLASRRSTAAGIFHKLKDQAAQYCCWGGLLESELEYVEVTGRSRYAALCGDVLRTYIRDRRIPVWLLLQGTKSRVARSRLLAAESV